MKRCKRSITQLLETKLMKKFINTTILKGFCSRRVTNVSKCTNNESLSTIQIKQKNPPRHMLGGFFIFYKHSILLALFARPLCKNYPGKISIDEKNRIKTHVLLQKCR